MPGMVTVWSMKQQKQTWEHLVGGPCEDAGVRLEAFLWAEITRGLFLKGKAWDSENEREMTCDRGRVFSLEEKYVYRYRRGSIRGT